MKMPLYRLAALAAVSALCVGVAGCDNDAAVRYPTDNTIPYSELTICYAYPSYYSYAEIAQKAGIIIEADVLELVQTEAETCINCYARVKVREVLKGDVHKRDILCVSESGFIDYGGTGGTTDGGPLMEEGNRVLLFLYKDSVADASGEPLYHLSTLGKFFYDSDGNYHASKSYNADYPHISIGARLKDPAPKTLSEIKNLIDDPIPVVSDTT